MRPNEKSGSLFTFDTLSSLRLVESVDGAIALSAEYLVKLQKNLNYLLLNPPTHKPGFGNELAWFWATYFTFSNEVLNTYHGTIHFLRVAEQDTEEDFKNLVQLRTSFSKKPQQVSLDQTTINLINRYTHPEEIKQSEEWLENLLNNVK